MAPQVLPHPRVSPAPQEFKVGDKVVIERNGRPWKQSEVERHGPDGIEITGGFTYCATTGERQGPKAVGRPERIARATPDRLAYLEVREFLDEASKIRLHNMQSEELLQLVELIRQVRRITRR